MSELKSLELQFCWQLTDAGVLLVPLCLSKSISVNSSVKIKQVPPLLSSSLDHIRSNADNALVSSKAFVVRHCIASVATDMISHISWLPGMPLLMCHQPSSIIVSSK